MSGVDELFACPVDVAFASSAERTTRVNAEDVRKESGIKVLVVSSWAFEAFFSAAD
jgi:hypothetical protein